MAIAFCICCIAVCEAAKFIAGKHYELKKYAIANKKYQEWLEDD